jgi:uncharacterized metal-binding protein
VADGKTHARITTALAVGATVTALLFLEQVGPVIAVGVSAGAWMGLLVDPDLDLGQVRSESEAKFYRGSRVLGVCWQLYWLPYSKLCGGHRSQYSHSWPGGTVLRLLYALGPLIAATFFFWPDFVWDVGLFWGAVFAGLSLSDLAHLATDWLYDHTRTLRRIF